MNMWLMSLYHNSMTHSWQYPKILTPAKGLTSYINSGFQHATSQRKQVPQLLWPNCHISHVFAQTVLVTVTLWIKNNRINNCGKRHIFYDKGNLMTVPRIIQSQIFHKKVTKQAEKQVVVYIPFRHRELRHLWLVEESLHSVPFHICRTLLSHRQQYLPSNNKKPTYNTECKQKVEILPKRSKWVLTHSRNRYVHVKNASLWTISSTQA